MGWTHALSICQTLHEIIVEKAGLRSYKRVADGKPSPALGRHDPVPIHVEYVDNFAAIGCNADEVSKALAAVNQIMTQLNIPTHEIHTVDNHGDLLGWSFDGHVGSWRPTNRRAWKIILAVRSLTRRPRGSSKLIERIVGHMTFIALLRRESLSCFNHVYDFIQAHRPWGSVIPQGVLRELQCFAGLIPLIWVDMRASWCPEVLMCDASHLGRGVVSAQVDPSLVKSVGQHVDKWRWNKHYSNGQPMKLRQSGGHVECEVDDVVDGSELRDALLSFPDVPDKLLDRHWSVVSCAKWDRVESQAVLEGRALSFAVKRQARKASNHHQRHLILTDATSALFAVMKGRSSSSGMLRVCRSIAAHLLATGMRICVRWLCSERRLADKPSRGIPEAGYLAGPPGLTQADSHPPHVPHRAWPPAGGAGLDARTGCGPSLAHGHDVAKPLRAVAVQPGEDLRCLREVVGRSANESRSQQGQRQKGYHCQGGGQNPHTCEVRCQSGEGEHQGSSPESTGSATSGAGARGHVFPEPQVRRLTGCSKVRQLPRDVLCVDARERYRSDSTRQRPGRPPRELAHGSPVLRRQPDRRGELPDCSPVSSLANAGQRGQAINASVPSSPQGLDEAGAASSSATLAVGGGGGNRSPHDREAVGEDGPLHSSVLPRLHETRSRCSSDLGPICTSAARRLRAAGALEPHPPSTGIGDPVKDGHLGRDPLSGRCARLGVDRNSLVASPAAVRKAGRGARQHSAGRFHTTRLGQTVEHHRRRARCPKGERSGALQAAPRRCLPRRRLQAPLPRRGQKARRLENGGLSGQVCQASPYQRPAQQALAQRPGGDQVVGRAPAAASVLRAMQGEQVRGEVKFGRQLQPPRIFIEIFCGSGHLASAVKRLGGLVLIWDITLGGQYDLTSIANQRFLRGLIIGNLVWGIHLGTPCSSFSRARRGRPPPIRSSQFPLGLSGLNEKDAERVEIGNCLMSFSIGVLRLCHRLCIPCVIENPASSMLFLTQNAISVSSLSTYTEAIAEFCMFGKPWRKSTKLIGVHIGLRKFDEYRCINKPAGVCKRTGCPHVVLSGKDPNQPEQFLTFTAQPYPRGFCAVLAQAFKNASSYIHAANMQQVIQK
ncbi:unnamed protein product [Polarella glacialis]|uniref:Uncharacterized protein n=2 Tax=Polarella glacialis TaxID=89957 RepID=A0A813FN03_POLGL|nr:unnamed protein product [Polarella glacialis]